MQKYRPPAQLLPSTFLTPRPSRSSVALPLAHTDLRPAVSKVAKPRASGKLGSSLWATSAESGEDIAVGLALLRLEQMEIDDGVFSIGDDGQWRAKGFRPGWWAEAAEARAAKKRI